MWYTPEEWKLMERLREEDVGGWQSRFIVFGIVVAAFVFAYFAN